jgi:dethiobiotin synthetase
VKQRRTVTAASPHPCASLYAFPEPVSPHLAARSAATRIDLGVIDRWVGEHEAAVTIIETAGGLFSPLGHGATNFELMQTVHPHAVILVALDRLGVLHELTTTLALAAARGGPPMGVVLSTPAKSDASTGTNARELAALGIARPIAVFPRAPIRAPASTDAARRVIAWAEHAPA